MDQKYFKPVRDARTIPPLERGVVSGIPVPIHDELQQVGGISLFATGDARLGEHFVAYGVGIDTLVFSGGYTAYRRLDEPAFLYIYEPNAPQCRTFEYRWLERLWYELVLAKNPEFEQRLTRFGPNLGRVSYSLFVGKRKVAFWLTETLGSLLGIAFLLLAYGVVVCGMWLLSAIGSLLERILTWF